MPDAGRTRIAGTLADVSSKTYRFSDFVFQGSSNTLSLTADGFFETAYVLDVDEGIAEWFGRGFQSNPLQAQGFIGMRLVNNGAGSMASGSWRIAVRNSSGRRLYNIASGDLDSVDLFTGAAGSGSEKNRDEREPFPNQQDAWETEPHEITIDFEVSSDITIDDAESETRLKAEGYRAEALE